MGNTTADQWSLDSGVDADQLALYAGEPVGVVLLQGITAGQLAGPTRIPDAVTPAAYTKRLSELFDSCYRASAAKIADCRFGKVLLRYLEELGLVELGNEGVARVVHGGDPVLRYVDQDLAANRRSVIDC
jgi:hypothetical protein